LHGLFFGFGFFETFFQIAQGLEAMAFVFANPTFVNLVQRNWIEIMQLLAPAPYGSDEVRLSSPMFSPEAKNDAPRFN